MCIFWGSQEASQEASQYLRKPLQNTHFDLFAALAIRRSVAFDLQTPRMGVATNTHNRRQGKPAAVYPNPDGDTSRAPTPRPADRVFGGRNGPPGHRVADQIAERDKADKLFKYKYKRAPSSPPNRNTTEPSNVPIASAELSAEGKAVRSERHPGRETDHFFLFPLFPARFED